MQSLRQSCWNYVGRKMKWQFWTVQNDNWFNGGSFCPNFYSILIGWKFWVNIYIMIVDSLAPPERCKNKQTEVTGWQVTSHDWCFILKLLTVFGIWTEWIDQFRLSSKCFRRKIILKIFWVWNRNFWLVSEKNCFEEIRIRKPKVRISLLSFKF